MADKLPRVLVDLNVILDVLQKREPFVEDSSRVWGAIERGEVIGFVAAHSISTLFYLLRRHLGSPASQGAIDDLLKVFTVAAIDGEVVRRALALGWGDFEDALQVASAEALNLDFVITRNLRDFPSSPVPVLPPVNLAAVLALT